MADSRAIIVEGLKKSFKKTRVLEGIDFAVERGTMLALLGPNGAGKTTTVRILSTLLNFDGGRAIIDGHDVATDANAVRHVIGLTGQYAAVDEYLTGRENLEMMGRLYHLNAADSKRRSTELLTQFDLNDAADRASKHYSGGMRRRLDLAASLVATPPILFLDEPTTGLDPRSRLQMWEVIERLKRDGATILLTTQYLEEADKLADRIAVIDHGHMIAEGTANELKSKVGKERLELVLKNDGDLEKASQATGVADVLIKKAEKTVSVPMENVNEVKRVLDRFEQAGIVIDSLSLHKPTLDDVFLQLTGKETEKQEVIAPIPQR